MDVQPAPTVDAAVGAAAQSTTAQVTSPQNVQGANSQSQPTTQPQQDSNDNSSSTLASAVGKLFGAGAPQPIELHVSYRVEGSDVVTVFTDPKTGKEVAQFPPELLLGLAQFFDKQNGVTLDKTA